ncbi:hypothetical protein ELS82_23135 [Vibrio ouci]|uniref:Uncharacterized protein n=1 Tax=Vibrio ouci TaxID=2499078 RepID=A0A4Y8W8M4_9VIBR|nr:hypothetical protein ELS82_23135 [Vibrio ouci]
MVNCRDYCQGRMLLGKYPHSNFKPEKHKPSLLALTMKQPTNICMFYGLRSSRTYADNADLLSLLGNNCQRDKELEPKMFKPLKYK